ncbi:MAG: efflux RND transporter permease subunit [Deltaproteobacteria bacterium]|nr:efflux RND transporter permease subunit [Deltaproteobacteria bacterium]
MIERIIAACAHHRWLVFVLVGLGGTWAFVALRETPLDAIPDLTDPQVIVFTDWMGRSPDLVEDQVTYPLVRTLQSTPGVRTVRGYSMFGMSFVYAIFADGTDIYWARTRVSEQITRASKLMPPGVMPELGPDATGIGWVFQYVLVSSNPDIDLAQLRALQDFVVRPTLQAAAGVSEIASLGGFERQFQIIIDPNELAARGLSVGDIARAVREANSEVGARVLEMAGREYVLRGRGYVRSLADLESSVVALGPGGTPILVKDVARARFGPEIRRGAADYNGQGEAVGGIVVMRIGSNALEVIDAVKEKIATLTLPKGVTLIPTYDRSELILGAVDTLTTTLLEEGVIVSIICIIFLFHLRSALVAMLVLPLSVLFAFIGIRYFGLSSNIMSLGGIAIAVGELSDAAIVLIENAHVRLAEAGKVSETERRRIIVESCQEVGRPIFFSLLLITVSFLPIFTLAGQAGRLFQPLAYTKTFAMFAAAILSITLAPALMTLLLRGRFRKEAENPVNRLLGRLYHPVARLIVKGRFIVVALAVVVIGLSVPVFGGLGSEFMPPLDEGSILVMPTTFPGISIEEGRRALETQDRIIMGFPEVASVHGKVGRAETATDPAQLDMMETVVMLKPRDTWPAVPRQDEEPRPRTMVELQNDIGRAIAMPGFQMAVSPPIRTRIDMLTTGVRTPVGLKVFGESLAEIERLSIALEGILRGVPGTRSTFAERQTGREYIDVTPRREVIARYGLTVQRVNEVVEAAIGGMEVSTVIDRRARFSVNLRYAQDFRADPRAIGEILVPVPVSESDGGGGGNTGRGAAGSPSMAGGAMGSDGGASEGAMSGDGMGGGSARGGAMATDAGSMGGAASADPEVLDRWRQPGATVTLGELADIQVVSGPPMIKDEDGVLVGYVFADIDQDQRDLGGWVDDAKAKVARELTLPPGYRLQWTGQYEFLAEMEARMQIVLPLTLALVVILLFLSMRGWIQTLLVLMSLPFALAGSVWLLWALDYNLSTAVWVGLIAVAGVAAETGIVMIVYLDEAYLRHLKEGRISTPADVNKAVIEGASQRVRPLIMTVATTVLGLLPLLWEGGVGADVSARTAAPVVGGLWSCLLLTLLVLPAAYTIWRRHQVKRGRIPPSTEPIASPTGPSTPETAEGAA